VNIVREILSRPDKPRDNALDGATWTRHSISIWSDIRKSAEERALEHPALFPLALVLRLIACFMRPEDQLVIDPFCGAGSAVLAARMAGKDGTGLELSPHFVAIARERLARTGMGDPDRAVICCDNALNLLQYVAPDTANLCVTSPPYWDVLRRRRSADCKASRAYGDHTADLGKIADYSAFLDALMQIMEGVLTALRPGAYCCVVVMDLRKRARFYPFHADVAARMQRIGFGYDDLIIWDRRHEYNNRRPLGYPYKFRINKTHEYILIFQKPA
jgi:DNA modification methylase